MSMPWKILALALGIAGIMVPVVIYITKSEKSITSPQESQPYPHAEIGEQCTAAATNYDALADSMTIQLDDLTEQLEESLAIARRQNNESVSRGRVELNRVRDDYWESYIQGYITSADYNEKVKQLDKVHKEVHKEPADQHSAEINRIAKEAEDKIQEGRLRVIKYKDSAVRLRVCAEAARDRQPFSVSDVAEFRSLIAETL
jgi:hypothetical protein